MHLSEDEKIHTLALIAVPGIGAVTVRQLINTFGSASAVYQSDFKRMVRIPGMREKIVREIQKKETIAQAEVEWKRSGDSGCRLLFYTDTEYPGRLRSVYDAPIVLYVNGDVELNAIRTVGVVGTRQVSEYGRQVTEQIVKDLSDVRPLIVSGLAYGVDIVAHRACLKHQVPTVGVMASGLDWIYPSAHKKTAAEMAENSGGYLTENAFGTKPDFMRFPARNRIIAGMSDLIIVVESGKKGGSLITVEFGLNYHRDVFAVPGNIDNDNSKGCNHLIRENKAAIFTSVEEMLEAVNWSRPGVSSIETGQVGTPKVFEGLSHDESRVVALLRQHKEMHIDQLSWQSEIYLGRLAGLLLSLEFAGIVSSLPGKKYRLS